MKNTRQDNRIDKIFSGLSTMGGSASGGKSSGTSCDPVKKSYGSSPFAPRATADKPLTRLCPSASAVAKAMADKSAGQAAHRPVPLLAGSRSFTLIELLVVMLIIIILAGITLSVSKYANWRARKARADIELQKIRAALDEYRAVYGEYPIVGDIRHYPPSLQTDTETSSNVPPVFRFVDLVNTAATLDLRNDNVNKNTQGQIGVEYLPFERGVRVDYRLTYPLKLRPESEGRPPFMDFPKVTVCFLVWRNIASSHEASYDVYGSDGRVIGQKWYMRGDPVNRILAIDPETGRQWGYSCSDGTTYSNLTSKSGYPCSVD